MKKQSITALLNCRIICDDDFKLVDIFVKNNMIFSIGGNLEADSIIDMQGAVLLPKFFNIHSHLGENLFPPPDSDCTIKKYLQYTSKITDNLSAEQNQELWNKSANLAISEMYKSGTIGFCAARSTEVVNKKKLITMSGYPFMISKKLRHYSNDSFNRYKNYYAENASDICSVGIFLHSLYMANESILSQVKKCYDYKADFIAVHVSEDDETRQQEIIRFGREPILVLDKWGLLTNKTIVVHGGYLSQEELHLIKKRNATIAICPISNAVLNTVCANIVKLKELGINWCIRKALRICLFGPLQTVYTMQGLEFGKTSGLNVSTFFWTQLLSAQFAAESNFTTRKTIIFRHLFAKIAAMRSESPIF